MDNLDQIAEEYVTVNDELDQVKQTLKEFKQQQKQREQVLQQMIEQRKKAKSDYCYENQTVQLDIVMKPQKIAFCEYILTNAINTVVPGALTPSQMTAIFQETLKLMKTGKPPKAKLTLFKRGKDGHFKSRTKSFQSDDVKK